MNGFASMMSGQAPQQQSQQPHPQQPESAPGPDQAPKGGLAASHGKQASPEMQSLYNRFVGACMLAIWDEKFMPKALKLFQQSPNQTDAMASIAAGVVQRVFAGAKKQGSQMPIEVMIHGGLEVVQQVADLASAAGVEGIEPDEIETAYYLAADKVRDALTKSGDLDASAADQDLEQLRSMAGEETFANVSSRMQSAQQKTMEGLMAQGQQGAPQ